MQAENNHSKPAVDALRRNGAVLTLATAVLTSCTSHSGTHHPAEVPKRPLPSCYFDIELFAANQTGHITTHLNNFPSARTVISIAETAMAPQASTQSGPMRQFHSYGEVGNHVTISYTDGTFFVVSVAYGNVDIPNGKVDPDHLPSGMQVVGCIPAPITNPRPQQTA